MGTFFAYILKTALILIVYYLFYKLLLSRETFHRFNRVALVSLLLLSFALPFAESLFKGQASGEGLVALEGMIAMATSVEDAEAVQIPTSHILLGALMLIYLVGIVLFTLRSLISYISLARQLRKGERQTLNDGTILCLHDEKIAPFSWMHYIVVGKQDLEENGDAILKHELGHIRNFHTLDLILTEVALILQWFNPAIWLMRRELQAIHEYEADEAVLDQGIDAKSYQLLLIKKAAGSRLQSITNSLHQSSIKKRITMMLKRKSNPWARAKYLLAVPVAALSVAVLSTPKASALTSEISECKVSEFFANHQIPGEENAPDNVFSGEKVLLTSDLAGDTYKVYRLDAQGNVGGILSEREIAQMYRHYGALTIIVRNDTKSEHLAAFKERCRANGWSKLNCLGLAKESNEATGEFTPEGEGQFEQNSIRVIIADLPQQFAPQAEGQYEAKEPKRVFIHVDSLSTDKKNIAYFVDGKRVANIDDLDPKDIDRIDVLKDDDSLARYGVSGADGVILVTTKAAKKMQSTSTGQVFDNVDELPEYPGGINAMMEFVIKNLKYPEQMMKDSIEGRVLVSFIVEKDGSVSNVEELTSPHPVLTEEAIRVVNAMPRWKPGKNDGKAVRVRFNLPLTFKLAH